MGEAPKRGEGEDPSTVDLQETAPTIARAPKETVKGMAPLQRAPASTDSGTSGE